MMVNAGAGLIVVGSITAVIALFALLLALPVWLGWNLGVVGISRALHGHVQHISLWVALGASLAIGVLSRIFHPKGIKVDLKK